MKQMDQLARRQPDCIAAWTLDFESKFQQPRSLTIQAVGAGRSMLTCMHARTCDLYHQHAGEVIRGG